FSDVMAGLALTCPGCRPWRITGRGGSLSPTVDLGDKCPTFSVDGIFLSEPEDRATNIDVGSIAGID
ncbi:MAG TPA: hypothetical protein VGG77_04100, partial [Roseiarcus sp.]